MNITKETEITLFPLKNWRQEVQIERAHRKEVKSYESHRISNASNRRLHRVLSERGWQRDTDLIMDKDIGLYASNSYLRFVPVAAQPDASIAIGDKVTLRPEYELKYYERMRYVYSVTEDRAHNISKEFSGKVISIDHDVAYVEWLACDPKKLHGATCEVVRLPVPLRMLALDN